MSKPIKILLAEDDIMSRRLYSRYLEESGYDVIAVEDGEQAWRRLQSEPVQLLITDWEMPVMNGLDLCKKVKSAADLPYIYTILLTARDDIGSLVKGLDVGADDYLAKSCDRQVFEARVRSAKRIIQLTGELKERNLKLEEANRELDKAYKYIKLDLELARNVQIGLLPQKNVAIDGVKFSWLFEAAAFVAGDTLDYFRIDQHKVAFYQLDVAGHGAASALHSFSLTRILSPSFNLARPGHFDAEANSVVHASSSSVEIVSALNRRFQSGLDVSNYFTMAYGVIDIEKKSIDLCLAGHQRPIYIPSGGTPVSIGEPGFPIGIFLEAEYESTAHAFNTGDRLFVHSDGIVECMNDRGEEFGLERLQEVLYEARGEDLGDVGETVKKRLEAWKGSQQFDDDISLLALESVDG